MILTIDRKEHFNFLLSSTNNCNLCERMGCRKKVLSEQNGSIYSKVLFIAEAPGRLGAECCGIPLYGDRTGDNFEMLLNNIGWKRSDIFITNSILCNPQDEKGNNSTPVRQEILNCSYYLNMVIELVNPDVIVSLGIKALEALKLVCNHDYELKNCVARLLDWNHRKLYPLYHMGPRAIIHRSLMQQRSDFIKLSNHVDPTKGIKKKDHKSNAIVKESYLVSMIKYIVQQVKEISMFKLTKLLYLIDYNYLLKKQCTMSQAIYLRLQEGPWLPTLKDIVGHSDFGLSMVFKKSKPYIFDAGIHQETIILNESDISFINEYINKYDRSDDAAIKIAAYLTEPMRFVIKQEKEGKSMNKVAILYKDKTIIQMYDE